MRHEEISILAKDLDNIKKEVKKLNSTVCNIIYRASLGIPAYILEKEYLSTLDFFRQQTDDMQELISELEGSIKYLELTKASKSNAIFLPINPPFFPF